MTLLTIFYIGAITPYEERNINFNETFNEICILFCIMIVMLFMMFTDLEFLDKMTISFIGIVGINVFIFGAKALLRIVFD